MKNSFDKYSEAKRILASAVGEKLAQSIGLNVQERPHSRESYSVELDPLGFTEVSVHLLQLFQDDRLRRNNAQVRKAAKKPHFFVSSAGFLLSVPSCRSALGGESMYCPSSCRRQSATDKQRV